MKNRNYLLTAFLVLFLTHVFSQGVKDTLKLSSKRSDSLFKEDPLVQGKSIILDSPGRLIGVERIISQNKLIDLSQPVYSLIMDERKEDGKEYLFYLLRPER